MRLVDILSLPCSNASASADAEGAAFDGLLARRGVLLGALAALRASDVAAGDAARARERAARALAPPWRDAPAPAPLPAATVDVVGALCGVLVPLFRASSMGGAGDATAGDAARLLAAQLSGADVGAFGASRAIPAAASLALDDIASAVAECAARADGGSVVHTAAVRALLALALARASVEALLRCIIELLRCHVCPIVDLAVAYGRLRQYSARVASEARLAVQLDPYWRAVWSCQPSVYFPFSESPGARLVSSRASSDGVVLVGDVPAAGIRFTGVSPIPVRGAAVGAFGSAVFEGGPGIVVPAPAWPAAVDRGEFCVEMWVRIAAARAQGVLVSNGDSGASNGGTLAVYLQDGALCARVGEHTLVGPACPLNATFMIALVSGSRKVQLFVNGSIVAHAADAAPPTCERVPMVIGAGCAAEVAELAVFGAAVADDVVAMHYAAGCGPGLEPDVVEEADNEAGAVESKSAVREQELGGSCASDSGSEPGGVDAAQMLLKHLCDCASEFSASSCSSSGYATLRSGFAVDVQASTLFALCDVMQYLVAQLRKAPDDTNVTRLKRMVRTLLWTALRCCVCIYMLGLAGGRADGRTEVCVCVGGGGGESSKLCYPQVGHCMSIIATNGYHYKQCHADAEECGLIERGAVHPCVVRLRSLVLEVVQNSLGGGSERDGLVAAFPILYPTVACQAELFTMMLGMDASARARVPEGRLFEQYSSTMHDTRFWRAVLLADVERPGSVISGRLVRASVAAAAASSLAMLRRGSVESSVESSAVDTAVDVLIVARQALALLVHRAGVVSVASQQHWNVVVGFTEALMEASCAYLKAVGVVSCSADSNLTSMASCVRASFVSHVTHVHVVSLFHVRPPAGPAIAISRCLVDLLGCCAGVRAQAAKKWADNAGSLLDDLELSVAWTCSAYASVGIEGDMPSAEEIACSEWLQSPLLCGGIESGTRVAEAALLESIVAGEGPGISIVESLRGGAPLSLVAKTVFKNEAAARAQRAVFAALVKHCSVSEAPFEASAVLSALYGSSCKTAQLIKAMKDSAGQAFEVTAARILDVVRVLLLVSPAVRSARVAAAAPSGILQRRGSGVLERSSSTASSGLADEASRAVREMKGSVKLQELGGSSPVVGGADVFSDEEAVERLILSLLQAPVAPDVLITCMARHAERAAARAASLNLFLRLLEAPCPAVVRIHVLAELGGVSNSPLRAPRIRDHYMSNISAAGSDRCDAVRKSYFGVMRAVTAAVGAPAASETERVEDAVRVLTNVVAVNACAMLYRRSDCAGLVDAGVVDFVDRLSSFDAGREFVFGTPESMALEARLAAMSGTDESGAAAMHSQVTWSSHLKHDSISNTIVATDDGLLCRSEFRGSRHAVTMRTSHACVEETLYMEVRVIDGAGLHELRFGVVSCDYFAWDIVPSQHVDVWYEGRGPVTFGILVNGTAHVLSVLVGGSVACTLPFAPMPAFAVTCSVRGAATIETDFSSSLSAEFFSDGDCVRCIHGVAASACRSCGPPAPGFAPTLTLVGPVSDGYIQKPRMWGIGQNGQGELFLEHSNDVSMPTECVLGGGRVPMQVVCGNEFTAVLYSSGECFAGGLNRAGNCGVNKTLARIAPLPLVGLHAKTIVTKLVAGCGCEQLLALTSLGLVYAAGANGDGSLGLGHTATVRAMTLVRGELGSKRVVDAALSFKHTVFLTADDEVFGAGLNSHGQLGMSKSGVFSSPVKLPLLCGRRIQSLGCGFEHTIVATRDGELFGMGMNTYGQLGLPVSISSVVTPRGIPLLCSGSVTRKVACGYYHNLLLMKDGSLVSFGRNDSCQCGVSPAASSVPTAVILRDGKDSAFEDVCCGTYFSTAIDGGGRAFAWGQNSHGQLGQGHAATVSSVTSIKGVRGTKVLQIACGFHHVAVITGERRQSDHELSLPNSLLYSVQLRFVAWGLMRLLLAVAADRQQKAAESVSSDALLDRVIRALCSADAQLLETRDVTTAALAAGDAYDVYQAAPIGWLRSNARGLVRAPVLAVSEYKTQLLTAVLHCCATSSAARLKFASSLSLRMCLTSTFASVSTEQVGVRPVEHAVESMFACRILRHVLPVCASADVDAELRALVGSGLLAAEVCPQTDADFLVGISLNFIGRSFARPGDAVTETVACELVALLRVLAVAPLWCGAVGKCLLTAVSAVRGVSAVAAEISGGDPVSVSTLQLFWSLAATLAVLGGHVESLRAGGHAAIGDAAGHVGIVACIDRRDDEASKLQRRHTVVIIGSGDAAEVVSMSSDDELIGVCDVGVPVALVESLPRILHVIVQVVLQQSPGGSTATPDSAQALLWMLRCRAMKALSTILGSRSALETFARSGLAGTLVSVLGSCACPFARVKEHVLERYWDHLDVARRVLRGRSEAGGPWVGGGGVDGRSNSWLCELCSVRNAASADVCDFCMSAAPVGSASRSGVSAPVGGEANGSFTSAAYNFVFDSEASFGGPVVVGMLSWAFAEVGGVQRSVLALGSDASMTLPCAGAARYTIVLDLAVASETIERDISILRLEPGCMWVVRVGGSVGGSAHTGGEIKCQTWYRLGLVVDSVSGAADWYVDGHAVAHAEVPGCSLPLAPKLFDGVSGGGGEIIVAAVQVRCYAATADELLAWGPAACGGVPTATKADCASALARESGVPAASCLDALELCGGSESDMDACRAWLSSEENRGIIGLAGAENVHALTLLGYSCVDAERAVGEHGSKHASISSIVRSAVPIAVGASVSGVPAVARTVMVHPGEYGGVPRRWACCHASTTVAPPCTPSSGGRIGGAVSPGARVVRGPHWNWGSQDKPKDGGIGFGTVIGLATWSSEASKGIRCQWDNGVTNIYRWGFGDFYDVAVIAEFEASAAGGSGSAGAPELSVAVDDTDSQVAGTGSSAELSDGAVASEGSDGAVELPRIRGMPDDRLCATLVDVLSSLYVLCGRRAVAALLEHSVSSAIMGEGEVSGGVVKELLVHDAAGERGFLRDYLRAFLEVLDGGGAVPAEGFEAVEVVRRHLVGVVTSEARDMAACNEARRADLWRGSISSVLAESVLCELSGLISGGFRLASGLGVCLTDSFRRLWSNAGSPGYDEQPVSVWRPVTPDGWVLLGDVIGQGGSRSPNGSVLIARDDGVHVDGAPVLVRAKSFELVWQVRSRGGGVCVLARRCCICWSCCCCGCCVRG